MKQASAVSTGTLIKVTLVAMIGMAIEFYDFFVAGFVAGIVWPSLFFPSNVPGVSVALGMMAYGVSFVSRPLGGFIFGHVGDRLGRKTGLIRTLLIGGVSMAVIAVLPGYSVIGMIAPILVVTLRFIFGIAIGGEYGGATALIAEHAERSKWRAFWTSWSTASTPIGQFAAGALVSISSALLAPADFANYGWRILFLIGALALAVGAVVRYKIQETRLFKEAKEKRSVVRAPALEVFKKYPWKLVGLPFVSFTILLSGIVQIPFLVPYTASLASLTHIQLDLSSLTLAMAYAPLFYLLFIPIGGIIGDKLGRRTTIIIGIVLMLLALYPYFLLIKNPTFTSVLIASGLLFGTEGIVGGNIPAILSESFDTQYRYSGVGIAYGLTTLYAGIIIGSVLPYIFVFAGGAYFAYSYMQAISVGILLVGLIITILLKETKEIVLK